MVGTALFASGAATAVTARKAHGTTSDNALCAGFTGADNGGSATCHARCPYH